MTYEEAKACQTTIQVQLDHAGDRLATYPRGVLGLTLDEVKATPQWKADYARYWMVHEELRTFNLWMQRTFKREIRAERRAKSRDLEARGRAFLASLA